MTGRVRLSPAAIFLSVITIVLVTLAVLTLVTARADLMMARRFAEVTSVRYELEEEGQRYIMDVDQKIAAGSFSADAVQASGTEDGGFLHEIRKGDHILTIEITEPDSSGEYDIIKWKVSREWNTEDLFENIWQGPDDDIRRK